MITNPSSQSDRISNLAERVATDIKTIYKDLSGKASTSSVTTALTDAKSYTDTKVAALVDSSPTTLDTLNELAAALGDDPNFATTVATQIGTKANSSEVVKLSGNQTIAGTKTFSSTISGSISGNAATATKATQDASGNVITSTYATKTELTNGLAGKLGSTANAASASKWATARTITLAGDASGSVSIDGSANKTLTVTVADDSHNHVISNVDGLQTALDGKSDTDHTHRFYTSLIPYGTQITASQSAPVDLNTVEYMKVGNYFCSSNASAEFITNLPKAKTAFMMAVYSPLSQTVDNETGTWVYRLRKISFYTGEEFIQYCYTNGNREWYYNSWEQIITSKSPASTSVLGPVKVGSNITVSSGTISLTKSNVTTALGYTPPTKDTTYSAASSSAAGLMSASDKAKLDGIEAGANKFTYTLPTAGSTLGGVKTTSTVTSTSGLTACPIIGGVPYYKDTNNTYTLSSFGVTATAAELNYVDGVTSNIQTQLNSKLSTSGTAAKATADASGNTITSTYATKTELTNGLAGKLNTTGGKVSGHIYLTGAKENSSTSNTSQIVFGTADNNHVCISSNQDAIVINESLNSTASQIVLYLKKASVFPSGIQANVTGNLTGTASKATSDASGNNIANTYATKASLASVATSGSYNDLANKPTIPSAYTLPSATSSVLGGVKVGSNITVKSGTISLSNSNVTSALGYTPIPLSGSRGNLAGYNTPTVTSSAITINGSSSDDIQVTGAVAITVSNGSSSTSWCKAVSITNASASVTLGSKWKWANGEAPTVSANCVLLLYWNNSFGLANIIATTA